MFPTKSHAKLTAEWLEKRTRLEGAIDLGCLELLTTEGLLGVLKYNEAIGLRPSRA